MIGESGSLCGIDLSTFLEIFASPVPDNVIPRLSLYFAIASLLRESPELHDLFPSMLELAASDLETAIRIFIDFCEMTPLFLAPHLQVLLDWVCPIIRDKECESRGPAMMILTTLASEAPILCRQSAVFYPMAMTCLLDVMTEITDAAPPVPDVSESEPWQLATDAFASIMRDAEGLTILGILFDLRNEVLANPTWNSIHAIFAATSVASPRLFASILVEEQSDELSQFMQPLADIAFDQDAMPRLRTIALQALTNLFRNALPGLDKGMLAELPSQFLQVIRTEQDAMIQYFAIDAFNTFLRSVPRHSFDMEFYELVIEGIQAAPAEEIVCKFLEGLGIVAKILGKEMIPLIPQISACFSPFLNISPIKLKVKAICSFCHCISVVAEQTEFVELLPGYMTMAMEVYRTNGNDEEDIVWSISVLVRHLKENCVPFLRELIPELLEVISQDLTVMTFPELNGITHDFSFLTRVMSEIPGLKQYVETSTAHSISISISLLRLCLKSSSTILEEFIERTLLVLFQRLDFARAVPAIAENCWMCLRSVVKRLSGDSQQQLSQLMLTWFLRNYVFDSSISLMERILRAIEITFGISEMTPGVLTQALAKGNEVMVRAGRHICEMVVQQQVMFDSLDEDQKEACDAIAALMRLVNYFTPLFRKAPDLALRFFIEEIEPSLREWLRVPSVRWFAIRMYSAYLETSGDLQKLAELRPYFAEILEAQEGINMKEHVFMTFVGLFEKFQVDRETAVSYYNFFLQILQQEGLTAEDNASLAADLGLMALSHLLKNNMQYFTLEEVIPAWNEALPIWTKYEEAEVVYSLLADFMESGSPYLYEPEVLLELLNRMACSGMLEHAEPETKIRFRRILRQIIADPATSQVFQDMFQGLREDQKGLVVSFIDDGEPS
jgi:hypothetical protein